MNNTKHLCIKYTFYISMIILGVTNLVFFICSWKDLHLDLSNESILLSFVGFLFAFAGINIYSIFNTNIELEKERIDDLTQKYEKILKLSSDMLRFPQEVTMIYQLTLFMVSVERFNINSYNWMREIRLRINEQKNYIQGLKDNYNINQFNRNRADFTSLAEGIEALLNQHKDKINYCGFFDQIPEQESDYKKKLIQLINFIDDLKYYEYEGEQESLPPESFCDKLKEYWNNVKKKICQKKDENRQDGSPT